MTYHVAQFSCSKSLGWRDYHFWRSHPNRIGKDRLPKALPQFVGITFLDGRLVSFCTFRFFGNFCKKK